MTNLVVCSGCSRHVRRSEVRCPFCGADGSAPAATLDRFLPVERLGRAALFAFAATTVAACGGASKPSSAPEAVAPSSAPEPSAPAPAPAVSASSGAPSIASAEPSAPYTTPPSPPADHGTLVAAYGAPPLPVPNGVQPPPAVAPNVAATEVGTVTVTGGAIANAERVAVGMRAGFGNCYLRGLATHPDAEGQVTLTIRVGLAGQILGVTAQQSNKVPAAVVSCLTSRAAASQFDPPTGAKVSVTVAVPVTFTKP